jgi:hypothetical protein
VNRIEVPVSRILRAGGVLAAAAGLVLSGAMPALSATIPTPALARPAAAAARPAAAAGTAVNIHATSNFPDVNGLVYVSYLNGGNGDAVITGQVQNAAPGEIIRLYAQSWPFTRPPVREQQQKLLMNGTEPYTFSVEPRLATRFSVKVFRSRRAATPLAVSGTHAVYVVDGGAASHPVPCSRPVCQQAIHATINVPASALPQEMAKKWFVYLDVRLGRAGGPKPAAPRWLFLDGQASVSPPRQVSKNSYKLTISFSFRIGNHRYNWEWNACTQDSESSDGMGLPHHHGCGDHKVSATASYLG